jgi:uncharacterized membrane protein YdjX (TVP38/TMEM64 family)
MKVKFLIRTALVIILAAICWVALSRCGFDPAKITPDKIRDFIRPFGFWAPVGYFLIIGQPLIPVPISIAMIAAGLIFGPVFGLCAAVGAATLRASSQFVVAKWMGREAIGRILKGRIASIDEKLGKDGFRAVLLIRIVPNLPYDIQNYAIGLSQVSFVPYFFATLIGVVPGAVMYTYLGYSMTDLSQIWKLMLAIFFIASVLTIQHLKSTFKKPA